MLRELSQGAAPTGETFLPCQGTLPSPWWENVSLVCSVLVLFFFTFHALGLLAASLAQ